ncbi:hypothetical protein [Paramaledivibacter caminithermalis]|jgi:hypothetical protein|uniref:DUF4129 domain-containing protein n=1 Tax=Paramaledivibacter caminithermalis (strain DSM 15212 / CIP 107654 / DViRD3) TaxID=1121301 RepID=A0A1M6MDJ4_PARC5|nr:hypothetical protein [Paramaledivibacter caminithermalis]SHJ81517.1 hypothetical protein SAMN02745912_01181 [Paramaledivibacter caminithermalis DSM 15212]
MKKKKIALYLLFLVLFFVISSIWVLAEERSIYVGDLIRIKVSSDNISSEELRDKFKAFEIVDIEDAMDGYYITLRSFETGKKKVQLGNKEIVIDIKSTLDEIKRDSVFEGNLNIEEAVFFMNWKYVFYLSLMIFILIGGIIFVSYMKDRRIILKSPYQHFMNQANNISLDDDSYFVKLTFYFKEYIESCYSFQIRGKTSSEIIDKISCLSGLSGSLSAIKSWLEESDRFKYGNIHASKEKKQELNKALIELVKKIEETKEGEL